MYGVELMGRVAPSLSLSLHVKSITTAAKCAGQASSSYVLHLPSYSGRQVFDPNRYLAITPIALIHDSILVYTSRQPNILCQTVYKPSQRQLISQHVQGLVRQLGASRYRRIAHRFFNTSIFIPAKLRDRKGFGNSSSINTDRQEQSRKHGSKP